MKIYITDGDVVRLTDENGINHWIPKILGNAAYEAFLGHIQTPEDVAAQSSYDATKSAIKQAVIDAAAALAATNDKLLATGLLNQTDINNLLAAKG